MNKTLKNGGLALLGAAALALPMALPATAHADNWNIHLGLGTPVYYRQAPVAVRYVPAPAPVRVTNYYPYPVYQRVVYGRPHVVHAPRYGWYNRGHRHGYTRVAYGW